MLVTAIHWFRRDLRLADNTALNAAMREHGTQVLPVFVLDETLLKGKDIAPARMIFLLDSLRELATALQSKGGKLVLMKGDPSHILPTIAKQVGASAVYFNRDYTPAARKRDETVTRALSQAGIKVNTFTDAMLFEPDTVLTGNKTPYTVFTPFKKAWLAKLDAAPLQPEVTPATFINLGTLAGALQSIPTAKELGFVRTQKLPKGGEKIARQMLNEFTAERLAHYANTRDALAADGSSRLSPHLRFGTVSSRQCFRAAQLARIEEGRSTFKNNEKNGADVWMSELIWREFYMQVLWHFPHANQGNFKREYDAMQWGSGNATRDAELFAAWREGRTGYPIVDAAMRQLNSTGWMHNRARMIVASFLTKDLLLDWRLGEAYFMQMLVDGDPASNNGGWQWAASTGTDAQPYFRIFNPWLQSVRFDPTGKYIRSYVMELERCPDDFIHEPSKMPPMLALQTNAAAYPAPIVDHATQKEEILRRFGAIKK